METWLLPGIELPARLPSYDTCYVCGQENPVGLHIIELTSAAASSSRTPTIRKTLGLNRKNPRRLVQRFVMLIFAQSSYLLLQELFYGSRSDRNWTRRDRIP